MAEVDPNTFFNIRNVGAKPNAEEPKNDDVFGEFEHHLNLPMGSTQEALDSAKQLIAQSKSLSNQALAVQFEESKFDDIQADEINDEVLRNDRARIRKEAHELYDMGKNMLKYMYDQVRTQIDQSGQGVGQGKCLVLPGTDGRFAKRNTEIGRAHV